MPNPNRLVLLGILAASCIAAQAAGTVRVETKDPGGTPIADAVVYAVPLDAPAVVHPPAEPVAITQKDQEFSPYVTPVVVGTRVVFPNKDNVQHHVYSVSPAKKFEIPLYIGESTATILFDHPGPVTLGCNIHDWMVAYILVLETPYFSKTGADGRADLSGLPAGHYRLEVWHPRLSGKVERSLSIDAAADSVQVVSVTLRPDRRIRRAPDVGEAGYR
ncbi:MAG TPA: methylamine utilization protein [Opitutaceae bacterium]